MATIGTREPSHATGGPARVTGGPARCCGTLGRVH
jgi:hypothetical protein